MKLSKQKELLKELKEKEVNGYYYGKFAFINEGMKYYAKGAEGKLLVATSYTHLAMQHKEEFGY